MMNIINPVLAVLFLFYGRISCESTEFASVFSAMFDYTVPAQVAENAIENRVNNAPQVQFSVTEQEFTALRIEYIKNQILKKLRLKEKPTTAVSDLPRPVKENENLLPEFEGNLKGTFMDDFYGKTMQAIILPYEAEVRCLKKVRFPSACVPFQMPTDIHSTDVSTVELWFHKTRDEFDAHNQTFVISEIAHWDKKKSFLKNKPIAIQETNLSEGWLNIDVTYMIKNWLDYQDSPIHAINIACKTCGMNTSMSPISSRGSLKPFLVIYTHSQQRKAQQHRRLKRSSDCQPGLDECCRESLYVSFSEIGWDDWILKPDGYNAYFCKGSCSTPSAITLTASVHSNILQKIISGENRNRGEITLCCAATQHQPLQLVYMINNTVITKVLSNMIVESCGCM